MQQGLAMLGAATTVELYLAMPILVGMIFLAAGIAMRRYGLMHERRTRARPNYPAE